MKMKMKGEIKRVSTEKKITKKSPKTEEVDENIEDSNTIEVSSGKRGSKKTIEISPPNMKIAEFEIVGTSPLVVHRFSEKMDLPGWKEDEEENKKPGGRKGKKTKIKTRQQAFEDAKYIDRKAGWEGFKASAVRTAMIKACSLVDYPMTRARLSIFVIPDGWDKNEPQTPLIRIYGKSALQEDVCRLPKDKTPIRVIRPAYYEWSAKLKLRWDGDQFTAKHIANLLMRVGVQIGFCDGRHSSPNSGGMGWGCFELKGGYTNE